MRGGDSFVEDALRVRMKPEWGEIGRTSDESLRFLSTHRISAAVSEALYMIISELLENSLKYGSYRTEEERVTISIRVTTSQIIVEVTNPFDESCRSDLETLDRLVQWIRGHQDPFEAYLEKLEEVSRKPVEDETSGLGLARIAYEGGALLDFFVDEKNLLNESALASLE
jgi:hypothetical protein